MSELLQVSSGLQDSSQYSGRPQQCCSLDGLDSPSDFQLFQSPFQAFDTVPGVPITIGITVTLVLYSFLSFLARSKYLSFFSTSLIFTLWSTETTKSTIRLVPFFSNYYKVCSSDRNLVICLYFKIPKNFMRFIHWDGFWFVHIAFGNMTRFNFLHSPRWIIFPAQLIQVLYSFCASLLLSLMWLNVSSLSPHNLH